MFDLVVRGGDVVTPWGLVRADIGVRAGIITDLSFLGRAEAHETLDAENLIVLPGVIDTQVHFREPGLEHKEDLASGTRAALVGGVTTVLEMPNTRPPTTTAALLEEKVARARDRVWIDIGFFVGATCSNIEALADLERAPHCAGIKVFHGSSTGELLVATEADLERVLRVGTRRVAIHAEDEARLRERKSIAQRGSVRLHPEWRDVESARRATERCVRLARAARRPIHLLHVTTAEELDLLAQARDIATIEVTPQHLTFTSPDCYDRLGSRVQMNPPIREARHREALWRAVDEGLVDVVGSDHAPHTLEEKALPYPQSPSGMPGVEWLLPMLLDHVQKGRLCLERMVDLLSHGPARVYGIPRKGKIARGMVADLVVVDRQATVRVSDSNVRSKCRWTPYDGMVLRGRVHATVLRGALVMQEGETLGPPRGQPVELGPVTTDPEARHRSS